MARSKRRVALSPTGQLAARQEDPPLQDRLCLIVLDPKRLVAYPTNKWLRKHTSLCATQQQQERWMKLRLKKSSRLAVKKISEEINELLSSTSPTAIV